MPMQIFLEHVVERMQIKLDQFCQEPDTFIKFANFPIVWLSKIQTQIALSTTESEYISLIQSMRYSIPFRHITLEVSSIFGMKCD